MPIRVSIAVLASFLVAAQPLAAQTTPATNQSPRFDTEIVVTPERGDTPRGDIPAAAVVLESVDIATLPAVHPSEVISFLPGFIVARPQIYAGRPVVSARGFFGGGEAEYVRLFVDGVPVGDLESGLIDWSSIASSSIRRIEASRGPGASLYGDSAIGGVVQMFTDRLATEGQFTATAGSFETFSADASYARRFRRAGVSLSAVGRRSDGGFEHASSDQMLVGGSADGAFRALSWRWSVSGDTRDADDPGALLRSALAVAPYSSDPIYRFDTVDRQTFSTAFVLRNVTSVWRPQGRVYAALRDEDLVRTIPLVPGFADTRARSLAGSTIGGSVEAERRTTDPRPVVTRFGIDVAREALDTTYRSVDSSGMPGAVNSTADGHRTRAGVFASTAWDAAARVRLTGAIRWDNVSDDGFVTGDGGTSDSQRAWSPRAGVVVHISERGAVNLFGQVSRAFKTATLDQLFDPRPYPDFQGGTFTISNPSLVPQRATNLEAGLSGVHRVRWSALVYDMRVDDEIDFDPRTFSYANIGESRHSGFELELDVRSWRFVQPSMTYAFSRVVRAGDELQLKNVPRHVFSVGANVDLPWRLGVYTRYHTSWGAFLDDDNVLPIDGASILDLRIRRPVGKHSVFADGLNLTADKYEEYGFTLVSFTGSTVPYAYPGAPRAVRIGTTLVF